jgi:hypothetical protein
VITALAGALLPYRAKAVYEASPGAQYRIGGLPMVTVVGVIGAIVGAVMVLMFAFSDAFGLNTPLAREVVIGVLVVAIIWYWVAKSYQKSQGIDVSYAFKEIPPE